MKELLETATQAVLEAGACARERLGRVGVEFKSDIDPVTEVDRANEARMVGLIRRHHPDHDVVAEEGTEIETGGRFRWYLDPLDGTVNYAHGLPWFSISAGLQWDGSTVVGAIYLPMTDELFTVVKGEGAFLNGHRIHVSDSRVLKRSILGTGFPYDVAQRVDDVVRPLRAFLLEAQGVRRVGSAAMDLAMVACGRYDGFWELGLHTWDVAAGILLIREAGGRVTDFEGAEGDLLIHRVIASNGHIHDAMLSTLAEARAPHREPAQDG